MNINDSDLKLLKAFKEPTFSSAVADQLNIDYLSVARRTKRLSLLGLLELAREEPRGKSIPRKIFRTSPKGLKLLELFKE